jgi:hypothetical protein
LEQRVREIVGPEFLSHSAWFKKHDEDITRIEQDLKKKIEKIFVPFPPCVPSNLGKHIISEIEGLRKEIAGLRTGGPPDGDGPPPDGGGPPPSPDRGAGC